MPLKLVEEFIQIMAEEKVIFYHSPDDEWESCTAMKNAMIGYSISEFNFADPDFLNACYHITPEAKHYMGITLILGHEIGHWKTKNKWANKKLQKEYWQAVEDATPESYPFIPLELDATKWGITWILNHKDIVSKFEQEIVMKL